MDIIQALAEGNRGAVARSNAVALYVIEHPAELVGVITALGAEDPALVSHAAHVSVTIFEKEPQLFFAYKAELLQLLLERDQWELLHQLAKILPHIGLAEDGRRQLSERLWSIFQEADSSISRACALQALAEMAEADSEYEAYAHRAMALALEEGSKAVQARARKLMKA